MPTIGEQITEKAFEVLESTPEGVRYSELVRRVMELDGSFKQNTVHGTVWNLDERFPDRVYKPSRGLFRLTKFRAPDSDQLKEDLVRKQPKKIKEEDFYEPFADWLVNEMEECTKAIALGGNPFRDKWGTPDVIGKRESKRSDIIQAPVEIVSAEIKPDVTQLVTAFGQACAYCLFSHKVYLVVSDKAPDDEVARCDTLCQVFGLGFVLFDSENPQGPTVYHSLQTTIPTAGSILRQSVHETDRSRDVHVAVGSTQRLKWPKWYPGGYTDERR